MTIIEQVKQAAEEIKQAPRVPVNLTIPVPLPIMASFVEGFQRGQLAAINLVMRARPIARRFLDATGGVNV